MSAVPRSVPRRIPIESVEPPESLEATGLPVAVVVDLVLKHLERGGDTSIAELGAQIALPLPLLERLLGFLRDERFVEAPGACAPTRRFAAISTSAPRRCR